MNQKQKNSQSSSSGEVIKTAKNVAKQKVAAGSLTQVSTSSSEFAGQLVVIINSAITSTLDFLATGFIKINANHSTKYHTYNNLPM